MQNKKRKASVAHRTIGGMAIGLLILLGGLSPVLGQTEQTLSVNTTFPNLTGIKASPSSLVLNITGSGAVGGAGFAPVVDLSSTWAITTNMHGQIAARLSAAMPANTELWCTLTSCAGGTSITRRLSGVNQVLIDNIAHVCGSGLTIEYEFRMLSAVSPGNFSRNVNFVFLPSAANSFPETDPSCILTATQTMNFQIGSYLALTVGPDITMTVGAGAWTAGATVAVVNNAASSYGLTTNIANTRITGHLLESPDAGVDLRVRLAAPPAGGTIPAGFLSLSQTAQNLIWGLPQMISSGNVISYRARVQPTANPQTYIYHVVFTLVDN